MSQHTYEYPGNYVTGPHVMLHMSRSINMVSKSRPLRSPVWDYFEIVGEKKVHCKLCVPPATTTLAYHGGTTSMQSHLSSHHPDKYAGESKGSGSQRKLDSFMRAKKCPAERAEEITRRIAEMVARPISIVEGAGFNHLLSYLESPLQLAEGEAQGRNDWLWTSSPDYRHLD